MFVDVVTWTNQPEGCHRCGRAGSRYIRPYWEPAKQVCPECVTTLTRLYDRHGWPPPADIDSAPGPMHLA